MATLSRRSYAGYAGLTIFLSIARHIAFGSEMDLSDVATITEEDFADQVLQNDSLWLITFHTPWCGHCKAVKPQLAAAAEKLGKSDNTGPRIGMVDCTIEKKLCKNFAIAGYPTIKLFRDGQFKCDYKRPRKAESFLSYFERFRRPTVVEINDVDQLEALQAKHRIGFVYLTAEPVSSSELPEHLTQIADGCDHNNFYATSASPVVRTQLNISADVLPCLMVVGREDHASILHTDMANLEAFIEDHRFPLLTNFDFDSFREVRNTGRKTAVMTVDFDDPMHARYIEALRQAARRYQSSFYCGYMDVTKYRKPLGEYLRFPNSKFRMVVFDKAEGVFYEDIEKLRPDNLLDSLGWVLDGTISAQSDDSSEWARFLRSVKGGFLSLREISASSPAMVIGMIVILVLPLVVFRILSTSPTGEQNESTVRSSDDSSSTNSSDFSDHSTTPNKEKKLK